MSAENICVVSFVSSKTSGYESQYMSLYSAQDILSVLRVSEYRCGVVCLYVVLTVFITATVHTR